MVKDNIKLSRLAHTIREHVLSLFGESNLNICNTQLKRSEQDIDSETCFHEQGDKKQKTTNYIYALVTHLLTQYLNNVDSKQEKL